MYVSVSGIDFGFSEHNVIQPNGKINANLAECFFNNTGQTIELVEKYVQFIKFTFHTSVQARPFTPQFQHYFEHHPNDCEFTNCIGYFKT